MSIFTLSALFTGRNIGLNLRPFKLKYYETVISKIAKLKGISANEEEQAVNENTVRLFIFPFQRRPYD